MNKKDLFWVISPMIVVVFLVVSQGWAQPKPGTVAPVITHSFAVEKGRYGNVLKLYVEADDPSGDMLRIATVAYQDGYGRHRPDWVYLRPENQKHFRGYLQWNTFGHIDEWTNVLLKVSVLDKAGNESNVVIFPIQFVMEAYRKAQPPAPFNQGKIQRLGHVFIDLAPNPGKTF